MFRNGGSEYAINGDACRLLDVQELLSDSGIGREMHVIVGQGQLDPILHATPEDRRGFIEEAAGVLKHRKRKEKALRKLDAMRGQPHPAAATSPARSAASSSRSAGRPRWPAGPRSIQADAARRPAAAARRRPGRSCARRSSRRSPTRPRCVERRDRGRGRAGRRRQQREADARGGGRARPPGADPRPGDLVPAVRRCASGCRGTAVAGRRAGAPRSAAPSRRTSDRGRDPEELRGRGRAGPRAGGRARRRGRRAPRRRSPPAVAARAAAEDAARRGGAPGRRARSAPPPTGARAWPGWPARSTPRRSRLEAARGRDRPARRRRAPRPAPGPQRAQQDFTALETQVAGLDAGEEGLDAEHEQARRPRSPTPRPRSSAARARSARPSATAPR